MGEDDVDVSEAEAEKYGDGCEDDQSTEDFDAMPSDETTSKSAIDVTLQRLPCRARQVLTHALNKRMQLKASDGSKVMCGHQTAIQCSSSSDAQVLMFAVNDPLQPTNERLTYNSEVVTHVLNNIGHFQPMCLNELPLMPPVGSVWLCQFEHESLWSPTSYVASGKVDDGLAMKGGWEASGKQKRAGGICVNYEKLKGLKDGEWLRRTRTWLTQDLNAQTQIVEYFGNIHTLPHAKSKRLTDCQARALSMQLPIMESFKPMARLVMAHNSETEARHMPGKVQSESARRSSRRATVAEPDPLLRALQVAKELEAANGAKLLQHSQPELNDDGIPQDDEPFCVLLFRDELMDFALERCTEPGRMLDVCSIFQFDVTYNCGEFKVTTICVHPVAAFKERPSISVAFAIHYVETIEVFDAILGALKRLRPSTNEKKGFDCVRVICTDADAAECAAIRNQVPNALATICSVHARKNMEDRALKLKLHRDSFVGGLKRFLSLASVVEASEVKEGLYVIHALTLPMHYPKQYYCI